MKRIIVYEAGDYITIGNGANSLTQKEVELLQKFIKKEKLKSSYISWEMGKFRFINYVGLITIKGVSIEILPKTKGLSKENSRKSLINMLVNSRFIDINYSEITSIDLKNENLLEVLAYLFTIKMKKELSRGMYKEYVNQQDNLTMIKGKLKIKEQLKNKSKKTLKATCEFDEFTEDNLLNGLFKSISLRLIKNIRTLKTLDNLNIILANFVDIESRELNKHNFEKVKFHRNNQRFYESFILMKKLLFGQNSLGEYGKDDGFCLLFEVNDLYEKYIGILCKSIDNSSSMQDKSEKLIIKESNMNPVVQLKPDIYIPEKRTIIDTKWKLLKKNENRCGVQIGDLYQMYAYLTRYQEVDRVILMYPLNDEFFENGKIIEKYVLEDKKENSIEFVAIDITSRKRTIEGIKKVFQKNNEEISYGM